MKKNALAFLLLCFATTLFAQTPPPASNKVDCLPTGQALPRIPELVYGADGVLRGSLYTVSEQVRMTNRPAGVAFGGPNDCFAQIVRAYRLEPGPSNPPTSQLLNPTPGPTLRARVGGLVALTFMNQIDPLRFPNADGPCDATSSATPNASYPGTGEFADRPPDCFNGSVYTNMHFHGTHTSPQTTADNVFLMIAPSPRAQDQSRTPAVTRQTVEASFREFFARCEAELPPGSEPKIWPRIWSDFPQSWREMQQTLLTQNYPKFWAANQRAIEQGSFPQYYAGAFPYCFRLPAFVEKPAKQADAQTPHTHGAGSAEIDEAQAPRRPLLMGQSPGTHWYHAHKHGSTTINVMNGMTGALIIEGKYDEDLDKTYGAGWTRRQPTMVINQLGSIPNMQRGGGGGPGPDFSVNGRLKPNVTMKRGEVQLWRIVNSSSRAGVYFEVPTGIEWRQLAQDGIQLTQHQYDGTLNQAILMSAGNRIDLLVKAPATATPKGAPIAVSVVNSVDITDRPPVDTTPARATLLTVTVTDEVATMDLLKTVPDRPSYLEPIEDKEISGTKKILFATSTPTGGPKPSIPVQHTIDGKKFDGETGVVVGLNKVEEWKVSSATYNPAISHPFHIHINPFQITEIFAPNDPVYVFTSPAPEGKCYVNPDDESTWKPCPNAKPGVVAREDRIWWDVFPIPSGKVVGTKEIPGYFKMRSRFVDYAGFFVIHCHILAHEDRGMMTVVQVAPLQSPYSHH